MNARLMTTAPNTKARNGYIPFNKVDFYKTGHPAMYPADTKLLVANFTPRTAKYAPVLPELFDNKVVWFGMTGFIKEHFIENFNAEFFNAPKAKALAKYKRRMDNALGKNAVSMEKLDKLHDLGYLPLRIKMLKEGSRVNIKVPPVLFISTNEELAFIATYFETLISTESWKPSTVATIAFEFRKLFTYFANLTGAPLDFVNFQGHDFSLRGMSGIVDGARCGAGHQASFFGTDTPPAIDYIEDYYNGNSDTELIGTSIPASEHSVMALRILLKLSELQDDSANSNLTYNELRAKAELEVIREFVTVDYPAGMVSIVSDTFDYWATLTSIAPALKSEIMSREVNELGMAKVVFRPDSGDPVLIISGYMDSEVEWVGGEKPWRVIENGKLVTEAERKGSVECLWDTFGGTVTDKGFKVLCERVGLIYGDSISLKRALAILMRLAVKGFASNNIVFGIGSFTYNFITRDTFGWAMKAIYAQVGNRFIDIYKDPATDDGTKKSARGLCRVEKEGNDFKLYESQTAEEFEQGVLEDVFLNSQLLKDAVFSDIRKELWSSWECPEPGAIPGWSVEEFDKCATAQFNGWN